MKKFVHPSPGLTRRAWIVLTGAALSACGGGGTGSAGSGGGSLVAMPGTGGTGSPLFSQGSITGFGSVIINGVKFDDTLAVVQLNGGPAMSTDLRLGMVADVHGEQGIDLTLGMAKSIEVWSIAQAVLTSVNGSSFMLAGMTIQTSADTVFDGITGAGQLAAGQPVAAWGLQVGASGAHWNATRVAVLGAHSVTVGTGLIAVANGQRSLNGVLLSGSSVRDLVVGNLVRVQGTLSVDGKSLAVDSVRLLVAGIPSTAEGNVEVEGYVTAVASGTAFTLGSIPVDATGAALSPAGLSVASGQRLEVKGAWVGGVLKATQVEMEDAQALQAAQIDGTITEYTSSANFVMRGQRCDASSATLSHGTLANLRVGVKLSVKGLIEGNVLKVATLEFDN